MNLKAVDSQPDTRPGRYALVGDRWGYVLPKSRLFVWADGREASATVGEMMESRWENPVREYRKALPAILAALGLDPATKARWSQYAGCQCPCSPGFILDVRDGRTYFATLSREEVREAA